MIDHTKITICGNCEHAEQTRWGLLCRRLCDGNGDDLFVEPLDYCRWGVPIMNIKIKGEGTE